MGQLDRHAEVVDVRRALRHPVDDLQRAVAEVGGERRPQLAGRPRGRREEAARNEAVHLAGRVERGDGDDRGRHGEGEQHERDVSVERPAPDHDVVREAARQPRQAEPRAGDEQEQRDRAEERSDERERQAQRDERDGLPDGGAREPVLDAPADAGARRLAARERADVEAEEAAGEAVLEVGRPPREPDGERHEREPDGDNTQAQPEAEKQADDRDVEQAERHTDGRVEEGAHGVDADRAERAQAAVARRHHGTTATPPEAERSRSALFAPRSTTTPGQIETLPSPASATRS